MANAMDAPLTPSKGPGGGLAMSGPPPLQPLSPSFRSPASPSQITIGSPKLPPIILSSPAIPAKPFVSLDPPRARGVGARGGEGELAVDLDLPRGGLAAVLAAEGIMQKGADGVARHADARRLSASLAAPAWVAGADTGDSKAGSAAVAGCRDSQSKPKGPPDLPDAVAIAVAAAAGGGSRVATGEGDDAAAGKPPEDGMDVYRQRRAAEYRAKLGQLDRVSSLCTLLSVDNTPTTSDSMTHRCRICVAGHDPNLATASAGENAHTVCASTCVGSVPTLPQHLAVTAVDIKPTANFVARSKLADAACSTLPVAQCLSGSAIVHLNIRPFPPFLSSGTVRQTQPVSSAPRGHPFPLHRDLGCRYHHTRFGTMGSPPSCGMGTAAR